MDERPGTPPPVQRVAEARAATTGRTNGKAIASLVLGIVGVTGIPFVASVIAIILGHMARREIAQHGEEGRGIATAGIVLGWVGVLLAVAGALIATVLFVNVTAAAPLGLLIGT